MFCDRAAAALPALCFSTSCSSPNIEETMTVGWFLLLCTQTALCAYLLCD